MTECYCDKHLKEKIVVAQRKVAGDIFKAIEKAVEDNPDVPIMVAVPNFDDPDDEKEYFTATDEYFKIKRKFLGEIK